MDLKTQLTQLVKDYQWNNADETSRLTKIITLVAGGGKLTPYLRAEKVRLGKTFENYYGGGENELLNKVMVLEANHINEAIMDCLLDVAKHLPGYKFKNFVKLLRLSYLELLPKFDSNFRGTIKQIHQVYMGKYMVIECLAESHVFGDSKTSKNVPHYAKAPVSSADCKVYFDTTENAMYKWVDNHWQRFTESHFYDKDALVVYPTFEQALLGQMTGGTMGDAMTVLWESSLRK